MMVMVKIAIIICIIIAIVMAALYILFSEDRDEDSPFYRLYLHNVRILGSLITIWTVSLFTMAGTMIGKEVIFDLNGILVLVAIVGWFLALVFLVIARYNEYNEDMAEAKFYVVIACALTSGIASLIAVITLLVIYVQTLPRL
ncbi:MAG: hypothetical protein LBH36_00910 [Candidatus Nomurabacteria bacterium]|jgi:hypothetical protein|nr:hypothetical protein [Candidatus Nomurabacteria bacterium]